jgi:hypothetical protein
MAPGNLETFSGALEDRGYTKKRATGGKRGFAKLVLASPADSSDG